MEFWDNLYSKYFKIWDQQHNTERIIAENVAAVVADTLTEDIVTSLTENSAVTYAETTATDGDTVVTETLIVVTDEVPEKPEIVSEFTTEPVAVAAEPDLIKEEVDAPKFVDQPIENKAPKITDNHVSNGFERKIEKARTSNEIKMVQNSNGAPKDVIRANDPPEDDLPKNIGVNKFVNFFESLGGKK